MGQRLSKTPRLRAAVFVLAAGQMISACASTSEVETAQLTLEEKTLREQSDSFVVESAGGGAIVLGAIGCVFVATVMVIGGGNGEDVARGCLIGGAIGAVAGGVDGYLNAKEAQYKTNETAKMQAVAEDVRADNEKMEGLLTAAQRVVENDRERLETLKAKLDSKQMSVAQAQAEAKVVRANSEQIAEILEGVKEKRDLYLDARNSLKTNDTAELDQEIARLNRDIDKLEGHLGTVNASLQLTGLG